MFSGGFFLMKSLILRYPFNAIVKIRHYLVMRYTIVNAAPEFERFANPNVLL